MARFEIHLKIELTGLADEFDVRSEEKDESSLIPSVL